MKIYFKTTEGLHVKKYKKRKDKIEFRLYIDKKKFINVIKENEQCFFFDNGINEKDLYEILKPFQERNKNLTNIYKFKKEKETILKILNIICLIIEQQEKFKETIKKKNALMFVGGYTKERELISMNYGVKNNAGIDFYISLCKKDFITSNEGLIHNFQYIFLNKLSFLL